MAKFQGTLLLVVAGLLLVSGVLVFSSGSAQAVCGGKCEDPKEVRKRIDDPTCEFCWRGIFTPDAYYYWAQVTTYSCSNGGTCTVTEEYTWPCGYCPI